MADDKALRRGRWAPMGMLSPGIIWLLLFFLVPVAMLLKASLSTKPSRFENPVFDWNFSNYADALSQYQPEFIRSFLYAGNTGCWVANWDILCAEQTAAFSEDVEHLRVALAHHGLVAATAKYRRHRADDRHALGGL